MSVRFVRYEEFSEFHDPMQDGKLIQRKTEIREDPLTGETTRILFDSGMPFSPPNFKEYARRTAGGRPCPFCDESVFSATPAYPDNVMASGRMTVGEAVVFPNLFPYGKHNSVVRMCRQHEMPLAAFSESLLTDAWLAAFTYLQQVIQTDPTVTHASINWNYLPPSGGSILHPHLHVMASEKPTRYQKLTSDYSRRYFEEQRTNYYLALLREEQRLQERWIGREGSLSWMHAFAPKSHHDYIGIFEEVPSIGEMTEAHLQMIARSVLRFFRYFEQVGLASFNLSLFLPLQPTDDGWTHIRLIPRITIGALETSDLSVFNFVHGEYLSSKQPENVAKEASKFFI